MTPLIFFFFIIVIVILVLIRLQIAELKELIEKSRGDGTP